MLKRSTCLCAAATAQVPFQNLRCLVRKPDFGFKSFTIALELYMCGMSSLKRLADGAAQEGGSRTHARWSPARGGHSKNYHRLQLM